MMFYKILQKRKKCLHCVYMTYGGILFQIILPSFTTKLISSIRNHSISREKHKTYMRIEHPTDVGCKTLYIEVIDIHTYLSLMEISFTII